MMSTLAHRLPVRFRCHILATVTTLLICTGVAFGQVPGEVTGVTWCSGPKTCLQWSPVGSATEYRVSRGGAGGFSSLSDASVDSCQTGAYFLPTTGSSLADTPTLGTDYWYLVVAANVCGQGPAGNMTAGPRFLNSSGPCNPQCTDGVIDGAETALDCGGPDCPACAAGQGCVGNADCASHVCSAGTCQTPTCADVRQNGSETGVDCGGACLPCPNGTSCCSGSDCQSDFCSGGSCMTFFCANGVQDGNETGVDCGGGTCPACGTGQGCAIDADCQSHICNAATHTCRAPACNDGVRNGTETDVDCGGGACLRCSNGRHCLINGDCANAYCDLTTNTCQTPTCSDGIKNGFETDVDCGGSCPNDCANGQGCTGNGDCQSGNCVAHVCQPMSPDGSACSVGTNCQSGNCVDGVCCHTSCSGTCVACNLAGSVGTCSNVPAGTDPADECSGAVTCNGNGGCGAPNGTPCTGSALCGSANCVDGVCCNTSCNGICKECDLPGSVGTCSNVPAGTDPGNDCSGPAVCNGAGACSAGACGNGVEDGNETDIDCGGGTCLPCGTGLGCSIDSDCQSHICSVATHTCQAPACNDGVRNGSETDVDCGGSCAQCANGQHCLTTSDCASSNCDPVTGTCQVSTCTNGVRDGFETDVDCGGPCPNDCANGLGCAGNGDCQSGNCVAQVCQPRTPDGSACSVGTNCLSGNCVDGVCCSTSCSGACMACNLAGSLGTCTNIPAGTDPANECSGAVTCNGNGGCGAPNGTACSGSAQCGSANCVDGVCCNTSCSGSCKACDLPGSVGTCSNIPAGTDPGNECPGARVCNGAGACTP